MKRGISYMAVLVCALVTFSTGCFSNNDMLPNEKPTNSIVSNGTDNDAKTPEKNEIVPKVIARDEINTTVELFVEALRTKDLQKFKELVNKNGLVVIRNFVTGGNGTRGKDVRDYYSIESIPKELQFPVKDEISIDPTELFEEAVSKNGKELPIKQISDKLYHFRDNGQVENVAPPTKEVVSISSSILLIEDNDLKPQILVLGENELVVTESQLINGLPVGGFAIFEKVAGKYYLRAIMDFR